MECIHAFSNPLTPRHQCWFCNYKTSNQILITGHTGLFTFVFVFALTPAIFVLSSLHSSIWRFWDFSFLQRHVGYLPCVSLHVLVFINVRKKYCQCETFSRNLCFSSSSMCCSHELQQLHNPLSVQHWYFECHSLDLFCAFSFRNYSTWQCHWTCCHSDSVQ